MACSALLTGKLPPNQILQYGEAVPQMQKLPNPSVRRLNGNEVIEDYFRALRSGARTDNIAIAMPTTAEEIVL